VPTVQEMKKATVHESKVPTVQEMKKGTAQEIKAPSVRDEQQIHQSLNGSKHQEHKQATVHESQKLMRIVL